MFFFQAKKDHVYFFFMALFYHLQCTFKKSSTLFSFHSTIQVTNRKQQQLSDMIICQATKPQQAKLKNNFCLLLILEIHLGIIMRDYYFSTVLTMQLQIWHSTTLFVPFIEQCESRTAFQRMINFTQVAANWKKMQCVV